MRSGLPDMDDIFEAHDDELGPWSGVLIDGHVDDETAIALTWAYALDYGYDLTFAPPERTWVRKVPRDGYMSYVYGGPGRGAHPVTRVEQAYGWRYWCDAPRCQWRFVPGTARVGIQRDQIANGDELGRQSDNDIRDNVYLCREHHNRYEADLKAARAAAMADYYAKLESDLAAAS